MIDSKKRMTRNEIMAIRSPKPTKTWNPISHKEVMLSLDTVLREKGIGVVQETFSTKNNGNNVFGRLVLDIEKKGKHVQIGWRNSISKNFAVGFCSGTFVTVCSNMMFHGEFIEFRKHTNGMSYDRLIEMGTGALDQVVKQGLEDIKWQNRLRKTRLDDNEFKQISFDAMKSGIIPPNHFKDYVNAHEAEVELTKGKGSSLYEFHGAVTRISKDLNLFTVSNRTRNLCGLCDEYTERLAA